MGSVGGEGGRSPQTGTLGNLRTFYRSCENVGDEVAFVPPRAAHHQGQQCRHSASTPSSRLGGSGGLLAEQRVGGLPLRIREARIEAVEGGRQALGVEARAI
jgi:hypothetical protein